MRVYVAGPYSAPTPQVIGRNVAKADRVARDLLAMGHDPFCPHKMTQGWEKDERFEHDPEDLLSGQFMKMDLRYVMSCGALIHLGSSPGADLERQVAENAGIPVYESLEELERSGMSLCPSTFNPEAPKLWHNFKGVQSRDAGLFYERSIYYQEEWRRFGPQTLVCEMARKLDMVNNLIGTGDPYWAAKELGSEILKKNKKGLYEGIRDLRVYATMLEAAVREEMG